MAEDMNFDEHLANRLDWRLWKRLLSYAKAYRWSLVGLASCAICIAGMDVTIPLLIRRVIDISAGEASGSLWLTGAAFGLVAMTFGTCVYIFIVLAGRITTGVSHDIRRDGFAKLQELSFNFYDAHNVGWLMARLTSDCRRIAHVMSWALLDIVWGSCLLVAVSFMMLWLDWRTGAAVLAVIPVLLLVSAYYQRRILSASRLMRKANSQLTADFNEAIAGMKTTKTLVREEQNLDEFMVESATMFSASMRNAMLFAVYIPLVMALVSIGEGTALFVGGGRTLAGALSVGTLVGFMYYAKLLPDPIRETARAMTELLGAQAAGERVVQLLETEPQIQDTPEAQAAMDRHAASGKAGSHALAPDGLPKRIQAVEFRDVSFGYREGQPVLRDFNVTVRTGQTVALVGPTGGGKSTIVSLLCRFYEPTAGEVLLNGVDYRRRSLKWLQSQLGIVLQTPHLFSGTIMENIRYGRLDATDSEVIDAARLVNAHEFITSMEKGYDAEVGQGGSRLSSGQKQLISFARAVLANPQIFVMDEATSSVDTETEQLIQSGLHHVLEGRISFIIAHRLSTVRAADLILVIDGGRIVEQGTHRDLLKQHGKYHELYTNQFTREQAEALFHPTGVDEPAE